MNRFAPLVALALTASCAATPVAEPARDLTRPAPGFVLAEHRFWSREIAPAVPATLDRTPEAVVAELEEVDGAPEWAVDTLPGAPIELWSGGPTVEQTERTRWTLVSWSEDDSTLRLGMMTANFGHRYFPRVDRSRLDASVITHRTTLHNGHGEPFALIPRGYDVDEFPHPRASDEIAFVCLPESECAVRGFVHRSNLGDVFFGGSEEVALDVPETLESLPVPNTKEVTLLDRAGRPSVSAKFSYLNVLGASDGRVEVVAYRFGVAFYGFVTSEFAAELREYGGGLGIIGRGWGVGGVGRGIVCKNTRKIALAPGTWIFGEPREGAEFSMLDGDGDRIFVVRNHGAQPGWVPLTTFSPWGEFDTFVRASDVLRDEPCSP